jgi:hypothetical protein
LNTFREDQTRVNRASGPVYLLAMTHVAIALNQSSILSSTTRVKKRSTVV